MTYKSTYDCVLDLERNGHLVRVHEEVDPYLEMAEIHRRVYRAGGPAVYYEKVKGSPFPAVSNLYGTVERARFIFRHTLERVKKLVRLKASPGSFLKNPWSCADIPQAAWNALPKKVRRGAVMECRTSTDQLPQIQCWPRDGGAFVLLPQVYTEDQENPGILHSNLGMYRVQLSGNQYEAGRTVGLHYQIRRDIGIHHAKALSRGEPLKVSIFIGGPPAHSFAAVMYLPEGLSEVAFAGALAGRRFRYAECGGYKIAAEADFCITGYVDPSKTLPEGPFGDHFGYYSLEHEFPFLHVESVYHRKNAVWPFTVVGRPPQEDSVFGKLIQEIAGPMIPREIPGVKAVHAVDASCVHPLLLAIGSERYWPHQERKPQELLSLANSLLGYGPCALAKYLMIVAGEDDPDLDIHKVDQFFRHLLERVDWSCDLHFHTRTTVDTLDYTGTAINEGSKVVMAAAGPKRRDLAKKLPEGFSGAEGFSYPRFAMPGVLIIEGEPFTSYDNAAAQIDMLTQSIARRKDFDGIPLILVVDDSEFTSRRFDNFLWVTFTRSDPARDIYGTESFTEHKHWGCRGPLVVDARIKPHHAPLLVEDAAVTKHVDRLGVSGGSLHGII
ncbi:MAG: UbiD family decarboxylase [Candidatus Omnitrophota bacterium]|nr:UbiD family decarboxylase [Candidatus Omnitrophota bacterium]